MDLGVIIADDDEPNEEEEEDPEVVVVNESDDEGRNVSRMDTDPEVWCDPRYELDVSA